MDKPTNAQLKISLDYRILTIALGVIIIVMIFLWRPWENNSASERTIEVTGQATVSATADEFVFYPSYEFKNADKKEALTALTQKSAELVEKLKSLGVPDEKIKTNSGGYDYPVYKDQTLVPTYTLSLTVTVDDKDKAQKVQDYLITTSPTGAISPQANFSDKKRTELENDARDKATKDARSKAEQSSKNLGFSLGSVKTVNDGVGFGGIVYPTRGDMAGSSVAEDSKLSIQPGENELNYTVTVTYFVR